MAKEKKQSLEGYTVLVVEDVETSARFFEAALSRLNATLLWAETGEQAISVFDTHPEIDIVLLDLNLPEISGFKVLEHIRKINSEVSVVVQSAYVLSGEEKKSHDMGANYFLEKPIRLDLLFDTLYSCIDK